MSTFNPGLKGCGPGVFCPGTDYPVSNYSSEKTDGVNFLAMVWPGGGIPPLPGGGGGLPGLGGNGTTTGGGTGPGIPGVDPGPTGIPPIDSDPPDWPCVGLGAAPNSQAEANLCAALSSGSCGTATVDANCVQPTWPTSNPRFRPPSPPGQPRTLHYNTAQSCTVSCANGSRFTYTVAAGRITNTSQEAADAAAHSLACQYAQHYLVCFTRPARPNQPPYDPLNLIGGSGWCCVGELLTGESVFGVTGPGFTISVADGSLPTGTSLFQDTNVSAALTGTLNVPGTYDFTLQATNPFGQVVTQAYTISVFGFVTTGLPDGQTGTPYSQQIVVAGAVGAVTYSTPDALPTGLTLDPTGLISGTPTSSQIQSFTVNITDAAGHHCSAPFSLTIQPAPSGLNWGNLVWPGYTSICGIPGGAFAGASFNLAANGGGMICNDVGGPAIGQCIGSLTYNGPAVASNVNLSVNWAGEGSGQVQVIQDGVNYLALLIVGTYGLPSGSYNVPFTVLDTGGLPSLLQVQVDWFGGTTFTGPGNMTGNGTIS